jgi:hypothetical protein
MKNQINTGDQKTPEIDQKQTTKPVHLPGEFKVNYLLIIIVLVCLGISGLGGYYLGRQSSNSFQNQSQCQTLMSPSPTVLQTGIPEGWETYSIPQLKLNFSLPGQISTLGTWSTEVLPGDKGNNVCFHHKGKGSAGGVGLCSLDTFTINATSKDFSAGRGAGFGDLSGYVIKDNSLFVNKESPATESTPKELYEVKTNANGVEYVLIIGRNEQVFGSYGEQTGPILGTPGDGYDGALINTNNPTYPGIVVTMKLEKGFDRQLLDNILSTFKFVD